MPMGTERELEQLLAVAGEGCAAQLASQLESGERVLSPLSGCYEPDDRQGIRPGAGPKRER